MPYQPSAEERVLEVQLLGKQKEAKDALEAAEELERKLYEVREANIRMHYEITNEYQRFVINAEFLRWASQYMDKFEYRYVRRFVKEIELEDVGNDDQGDYATVYVHIERWRVPLEILTRMEKVTDEPV